MISLAGRDILHSWSKFVLTGIGLGLLIGVTLTMAGVYRGMVDDARALLNNSGADLWVVQQDTQGPYAESSSLRDDAVRSVLGLPGVARAANVTYLTMQVRRASASGAAAAGSGDDDVRAMVVGFEPGQPGEPGDGLCAGGVGRQGRGGSTHRLDSKGAAPVGARWLRSGNRPWGRSLSTRIRATPTAISRSAAACSGETPGTASAMKRVPSRKAISR